jgi:hypothetical protein
MGARRLPSSSRAGPGQRPGAASPSVAHWCEGSADGALRVERPKGGVRGLQGELGGAGRGVEGGVSLQGGGDAEAEASEAQGEGELSHNRIRREVLWGRVVHQEKGGVEYLTFSSGDVGGEPLPRRGAGEVGEAGLEGRAEQEELVLRGEGKGRERGHQTLVGGKRPPRAVGDALGGSGGSARVC